MSENQIIEVILPIGELPSEATVAKITGQKEYLVKDKIIIYRENKSENPTIHADKGARFLIDGQGNVNAIGEEQKVKWIVKEEYLLSFLEGRSMGDPK